MTKARGGFVLVVVSGEGGGAPDSCGTAMVCGMDPRRDLEGFFRLEGWTEVAGSVVCGLCAHARIQPRPKQTCVCEIDRISHRSLSRLVFS